MHNVMRQKGRLDLTNPETGTRVRIRYRGDDYGKDYSERKLDHLNIHIRVLEQQNPLGVHYLAKLDENEGLILMANLDVPVPSLLDEETLCHMEKWISGMKNDIRWLKPIMEQCFPRDRLI